MPRHTLFIVLLSLVLNDASGQALVNADFVTLQPQIGRDEQGFKSCGIRAVVLVGKDSTGHVYDYSINVWANTFSGLIKAGKYNNVAYFTKSAGPLKAVTPGPLKFWIAAADQGVPLSPTKLIPAESVGFILGGTELDGALRATMDIATGKQMQFALRYKYQHVDQVVAFRAKLSQSDLDALLACFAGMRTRMAKMVEDESKDTK